MRLSHNWRRILARAWSVRLIVLAVALSAAEVVLQFVVPNWPAGALAFLNGLVTAAALVARLIVQSNLEDT